MEYKVLRKWLRTEANTTMVVITCEAPYTHIERELEGDKLAEPDDKLIELVLERVQMENDPSSTLARLQETVHQANTTLTSTQELLAKTEKTQETIRGSIMEMNETLLSLMNDVDALKEAAEGEDTHVETTPNVADSHTTEGGE